MPRYLKEILLVLWALTQIPAVVGRMDSVDGLATAATYLGLLVAMLGAIGAAAYTSNSALRWGSAIILAISGYFVGVYERVTTQFMTYDAFINMINSASFAGDALAHNYSSFIAEMASPALLMIAIGLNPLKKLNVFGPVIAAGPWLGVALLTGILFIRGGDGARGLPDSFKSLAYAALSGYESLTGNLGPRASVQLPQAEKSPDRNIVLIVDESIAGQYLDINSPSGVATPLSRQWPGIAIHNFGIAASISTCSHSSNVTLRYGGTRDAYQRINATMPSVWAYARKAGLRTVYIDAQRTNGGLQNQMNERELALVDTFIQFPDVPIQQRDMAVADELVRLLADPEPKFILINKMGAHFPVHDKYPDSHLRYKPTLPRGNFTDISDTGSRKGFDGDPESWRLYRNAYRNTLLWNVGTFFERVLNDADLSRTTMIYTSDHGQNLHENGQPGTSTHCSSFPNPEEGAVPLVVIDSADLPGADWQHAFGEDQMRSSHYRIFPTLLQLMGYRRDAIAPIYGPSLADGSHDPGTFNALFNARLNRKPVWIAVEPGELAVPPATDFADMQD